MKILPGLLLPLLCAAHAAAGGVLEDARLLRFPDIHRRPSFAPRPPSVDLTDPK